MTLANGRAATGADEFVMPVSRAAAGYGGVRPATYHVVCTDQGEVRIAADMTVALTTSHTFVDDLPIAVAFGDVLPPPCADLVDVAVAVYAADRLCRRHPQTAPRSEPLWHRRMHVRVPVREPDRWTDVGGPGDALAELLRYLTDDTWALSFEPRRPDTARASEAQRALFREPAPAPASAALFSGGLDSLAGLVTVLVKRPSETVVLFSGRTNKRIGAPQRALLHELRSAFPRRMRSVAVRFGLDRRTAGAYDREETSQRTRGFIFQAFGAVTARMAGLDRLDVYENGVGAINLPYTAAQLGSQATRATHPVTLRLMSALLTRLFERPFTVALPHAFSTKGEICIALHEARLGHLAAQSVSCDGYPQRAKRAVQCGVCPSCLLRRQSLHHAKLRDRDPSTHYVHDIYDASARDARARRFSLRAMGAQVHQLRQALSTATPWEALIARYPELGDAADALAGPSGGLWDGAAVREALIDLYGRYCREWATFAASTAGHRDLAPDGTPVDNIVGDMPWSSPTAPMTIKRRAVSGALGLWDAVEGGAL